MEEVVCQSVPMITNQFVPQSPSPPACEMMTQTHLGPIPLLTSVTRQGSMLISQQCREHYVMSSRWVKLGLQCIAIVDIVLV